MDDATPPVLDLRPAAASRRQWLIEMVVDGAMPRTYRGSVLGYGVAVQRTKRRGMHEAVLMHLAAPDGRVLNVAVPCNGRSKDARDQVAEVLSTGVRRVLRTKRRTDEGRETMAAELDRLITEGLRCLSEGVDGTPALIRVASAVEQVDPVRVLSFDPFAPLQASQIAEGDLSVRQIAQFIRHGFTRESAMEWFGKNMRERDTGVVAAMAAFRDAGWTLAQVRTAAGFERGLALNDARNFGVPYVEPKTKDIVRLVALTWDEASLALSAGVRAKTAVDLKRGGEWDGPALTTLAALRRDLSGSF